jgi:demethylmenaquinone methyltransferase/2-methoxy-6-polyprenyl-1,4-benzoquinol methylase
MQADSARSVQDYAALAPDYDRRTRLINRTRRRAVAALDLKPGETVLDAGCGTGFCLGPLADAIGPHGRILAFDPSRELLHIARERIARAGWRNVDAREGTAEATRFEVKFDALLLSYVHDLMQSEAALDNLLAQAKPGARVAVCGSVLWPRWGWPVNAWLRLRHRGYITRPEALGRPWARLAPRLANFRVEVQWPPDWRYLATGRVP